VNDVQKSLEEYAAAELEVFISPVSISQLESEIGEQVAIDSKEILEQQLKIAQYYTPELFRFLLDKITNANQKIQTLEEQIELQKDYNEKQLQELALLAADELVPMEVKVKRLEKRAQRMKERLSQEVDSSKCVICFERKRDTVIMPCSHFAVCRDCGSQLKNRCPICRESISSVKLVYKA
jgi:hypothetical protein